VHHATGSSSESEDVNVASRSSSSAAIREAEEDRTRNGLRKRTPRGQRAGQPAYTRPPNRVIDLDSAPRSAAIVNDSPAQVSARLTALRAGIQRGKATPDANTSRPGHGGNEREVKETE
jgi:hypothetical protein